MREGSLGSKPTRTICYNKKKQHRLVLLLFWLLLLNTTESDVTTTMLMLLVLATTKNSNGCQHCSLRAARWRIYLLALQIRFWVLVVASSVTTADWEIMCLASCYVECWPILPSRRSWKKQVSSGWGKVVHKEGAVQQRSSTTVLFTAHNIFKVHKTINVKPHTAREQREFIEIYLGQKTKNL